MTSMVQQGIQQAIEAWVEQGRDRESVVEGNTCVLRYGRRFKFQHVMTLALFGFFFLLGILLMQMEEMGDPTANLVCTLFFGTLTTFSLVYVTYVFTSRVEIDDTRVAVRCFGLTISECTRKMLATACRSPIHDSVVLQNHDGKKTRISAQFDGLLALVAWLRSCPDDVLSDSIVTWMDHESPR